MAMRGNNFFHKISSLGQSIASQSIATATTVNGATIAEPWKIGRQLIFDINSGAIAAGALGRLNFQGQKRSDGSWEALKDKNNADLVIDGFDDATSKENACLIATLPLSAIDSTTYKAVRVNAQNEAAFAWLISVTHFITDLYSHPGDGVDQTYALLK